MSARRGVKRLALALICLALFATGPAGAATAEPVLGPPPASVSVSQRATMAVLSWPEVPGATGYAVDFGLFPGLSGATRATSTETFVLLSGLTPDTLYYARVATWDEGSATAGAWGPTISFTTGPQEYAIAAPALAVSSESSTSITATWTSAGPGLAYQVSLGKSPGQIDLSRVVEDTDTTFDELAKKTTYYVSVRAVDAGRNAVSAWSEPIKHQTPEQLPLRVGSYNILCENCSKGKASWAARRGPLVDAIRDQDLDVLGVQEASIGNIPGGGPQYRDLIDRLGKPYKLTEEGRGVSPDVRVIYNAERLTLIKHGIVSLPRGASRRFLSWAIFEQKSTDKRFFFSNTHLEPADGKKAWSTRKAQAKAIVAATDRLKDRLPVIAVGDYASTKWEKWGNDPYDVMEAAGYADPLGNAYRSRGTAPGAFVEKRINTSFASLNMYKRKARNFAGHVNGSNTDYIFTTPMRVSEYEVVVKVDSAGRFIGVIPSDHNLIRAAGTVERPSRVGTPWVAA